MCTKCSIVHSTTFDSKTYLNLCIPIVVFTRLLFIEYHPQMLRATRTICAMHWKAMFYLFCIALSELRRVDIALIMHIYNVQMIQSMKKVLLADVNHNQSLVKSNIFFWVTSLWQPSGEIKWISIHTHTNPWGNLVAICYHQTRVPTYLVSIVSDLVSCKLKYGYAWHGMSLLRPDVSKQHKLPLDKA